MSQFDLLFLEFSLVTQYVTGDLSAENSVFNNVDIYTFLALYVHQETELWIIITFEGFFIPLLVLESNLSIVEQFALLGSEDKPVNFSELGQKPVDIFNIIFQRFLGIVILDK